MAKWMSPTLVRSVATAAASSTSRGAAARPHCPSIVLCADFDETITAHDSIALLFRLAGQTSASPPQHSALVQRLVERYASESSAFMAAQAGRGASAALDLDALHVFLEGYAATDWQSVERVIHSRVLRGVALESLRQAGRSIGVRDGCAGVLSAAQELHVVSTNWSAEMVRAALDEAVSASPGSVSVWANDLVADEAGVTTGDIAVNIQSPADKARAIRRIRQAQERAPLRQDSIIVYVGDGVNDVLAMLEADVGISLQDAKHRHKSTAASSLLSTLHGVATHHGVSIKALAHSSSLSECASAAEAARARNARVLFAAASWADIARVIAADAVS